MTQDNPNNHAQDALTLKRLPEVKARCGLSRSEIYRRIAAGDFPKPIKLGERVGGTRSDGMDRRPDRAA